jgi:serine/threonine-protein kinase
MRLNLQAPDKSSLLSIYLPRPTKAQPVLLEDSSDLTWTGTLPQSGYYEIVVVNSADQPIRYQLTLAVDNISSTPAQLKPAEAPEAKQ